MNSYSLSSTSRRWWMPSAAVGATFSLTIGALFAASASSAMPAPPEVFELDAVGSVGAVDSAQCTPPPDVRFVGGPWVSAEPTGCDTLDRWWRHVDDQLCVLELLPYSLRSPVAIEGWYQGCLLRRKG